MLFCLVLGREKLNILVTSSELYLVFLINLLSTRDKKMLVTLNMDSVLRESRLPSLAKVMFCLVRVGVPQVSWAVRYLDKL